MHMETYRASPDPSFPVHDTESNPRWDWLIWLARLENHNWFTVYKTKRKACWGGWEKGRLILVNSWWFSTFHLVSFPDPLPKRKGGSGEYSTFSHCGLAVAMDSLKASLWSLLLGFSKLEGVCKGVMSKAKRFAVRKPKIIATSVNQIVPPNFRRTYKMLYYIHQTILSSCTVEGGSGDETTFHLTCCKASAICYTNYISI